MFMIASVINQAGRQAGRQSGSKTQDTHGIPEDEECLVRGSSWSRSNMSSSNLFKLLPIESKSPLVTDPSMSDAEERG